MVTDPRGGDQYDAQSSLRYWVKETASKLAELPRFRRLGTVQEVTGLTVVSNGPPAQVGELCRIEPRGNRPPVQAQVVGFRDNRVLLMPLGELQGVEAHCPVIAAGERLSVPVGPSMKGRIVDACGEPVDGGGPITAHTRRPVHGDAPHLAQRRRVTTSMSVGVRAIDLLLTCGEGQRLGVFGGSGVGKSVLMGMIARNSTADVNVIALVGERGREVLDFVEEKLGPARDRSIVVAATSDQPPLVRLQAGFAATTIAEHFRDRGADVLLMMDSITRLARAQREVGLTIGEMPTNRGYPPSVYEVIPRLVERVGPAATGTITGIYTILVEGDDMLEPVADTVRATLDGHIILSRE
ncbi:MAG: FliI/YscN family ATPase, partial [Armatimonadota bacterium]